MSKLGNLSDKINEILTSAPVSFDPEDEDIDGTFSKLSKHDDEEHEDDVARPKLVNPSVSLDEDERYAGKVTSRKSLQDPDNLFSDETASAGEENGSEEVDESDEEDDSDVNEEEDESNEDEQELSVADDDDGTFKHMSDYNISDEVTKGLCVRNQISMWENLLEMRIQLQKCLLTANKMPQTKDFLELRNEQDEGFREKASDTEKKLRELLEKMLLLQTFCLKQYPETKQLLNQENDAQPAESDEVVSETDEKVQPDDLDEPPRKRKYPDFETQINNQHTRYKKYRTSVIQKWDDKTRLTVTKNASPITVLNQIDHVLADKTKLLKRTQLKRSNYTIVGKSEDADEQDAEIFDDDDFYHQMLRELIEFKSADVTDPIQLGRQWVQLQNMRRKMRKTVDTRATKGRKIRYSVHSKLVNYMAPIEENAWTSEAKAELFGSLFGRKQMVVKDAGVVAS